MHITHMFLCIGTDDEISVGGEGFLGEGINGGVFTGGIISSCLGSIRVGASTGMDIFIRGASTGGVTLAVGGATSGGGVDSLGIS